MCGHLEGENGGDAEAATASKSRRGTGAMCGREEDAVGTESDNAASTRTDMATNANEGEAPEDATDQRTAGKAEQIRQKQGCAGTAMVPVGVRAVRCQ